MSCQATVVEKEQFCPVTGNAAGTRYCDEDGACPFDGQCQSEEKRLERLATYHVQQRMDAIISSGEDINGFLLHEALLVATLLVHQDIDACWERSMAAVAKAARAFARRCEECIHACAGKQLGEALQERDSLTMHTVRSGNLVVSFIHSEAAPRPEMHPAGTGRVTLEELEAFERNVLEAARLSGITLPPVIDMAKLKIEGQIRRAVRKSNKATGGR